MPFLRLLNQIIQQGLCNLHVVSRQWGSIAEKFILLRNRSVTGSALGKLLGQYMLGRNNYQTSALTLEHT